VRVSLTIAPGGLVVRVLFGVHARYSDLSVSLPRHAVSFFLYRLLGHFVGGAPLAAHHVERCKTHRHGGGVAGRPHPDRLDPGEVFLVADRARRRLHRNSHFVPPVALPHLADHVIGGGSGPSLPQLVERYGVLKVVVRDLDVAPRSVEVFGAGAARQPPAHRHIFRQFILCLEPVQLESSVVPAEPLLERHAIREKAVLRKVPIVFVVVIQVGRRVLLRSGDLCPKPLPLWFRKSQGSNFVAEAVGPLDKVGIEIPFEQPPVIVLVRIGHESIEPQVFGLSVPHVNAPVLRGPARDAADGAELAFAKRGGQPILRV